MSLHKRLGVLVVLALAFAGPMSAAEHWWDSYNRGVAAVRAKNYEAASEALQRSLAEMPAENGSARARNEIITYVPHFWLGIAKFNLSDVDGALREWKISEEQGVVQNTPYFAQLRDWQARAQSEKQHRSENAAGESKREANAAVGRAVSAQMDAVAAGADRTDGYRAAQRKLQEAMDANARGGTEIRAYKRVTDLAGQARDLFAGAAEDARKRRASRAPVVAQQAPAPQPVAPPRPAPEVAASAPAPSPVANRVAQAPAAVAPPVESAEVVHARMAVQQYRRHLVEMHLPADEAQKLERALQPQADAKTIRGIEERVAVREGELATREARAKTVDVTSTRPEAGGKGQLEAAYRAFAAGDLARSEQQLSRMLAAKATAEAFLLRGCARYTEAMLSRDHDAALAGAASDFRSALKLNRSLRLDRAAFSPKLVAYFEQLRKSS